MDISRITRNLSVAVRAERLILRHQLDRSRRRAALGLVALVAGGLGLIALNAAVFLELAEDMDASTAALVVAIGDFGLMGLAAALARSPGAKGELESVEEVRDLALRDLEAELQAMASKLRPVARDPVGTVAPQLIGVLASAIIKALRKP